MSYLVPLENAAHRQAPLQRLPRSIKGGGDERAAPRRSAMVTANRRLVAELRQQINQLLDSRDQIAAAEERLRRDIAETLHGTVQCKLLVAGYHLTEVAALMDSNPGAAKELLASTQKDIETIREKEIREASHLLHPSIIGVGLVPAVRSLIARFEEVFRVSLRVDPRLTVLDTVVNNRLPEAVRLTAYRAIEEALTNIWRHAGASLAEVDLSLSPASELHVVVEDNGRGFDSRSTNPGLGLSSIAGRVSQMAGTWKIAGRAGRGARIEITLPIEVRPGAASHAGTSALPSPAAEWRA